ncbi:PREDICTED: uncharacterized protein LOC106819475 [Priapulus caudatus]|uniref:Uncharacterized protein LOC106819475 n=1 Tax=Priapulus caudatus TaxID=37621 RepID=A0ABM1F566_PRICU|nr:PREDICTED: uncharacterized protein LOC106819475 [Priapulus caudatus]
MRLIGEDDFERQNCRGSWRADDGSGYEASWQYDPATDRVLFSISQLPVDDQRWIAIGFSSNRRMPNTDVVYGWISNNQPRYFDGFLSAYAPPSNDENNRGTNDVILSKFAKIGNKMTMVFSKPRLGGTDDVSLNNVYLVFPTKPGFYLDPGAILKHDGTPTIGPRVDFSNCDHRRGAVAAVSPPLPPSTASTCEGGWETNDGATYRVVWQYDPSSDGVVFTVTVGRTDAWVAIGFSQNRRMRGALVDYTGVNTDETSEIRLLAAERLANKQTIQFWKPRVGGRRNDFTLHDVHLILPTKPGRWSERPQFAMGKHEAAPTVGPKVFFNTCVARA